MKRVSLTLLAASISLLSTMTAQAHSVAQVQTAKRIAQSTVIALDPQGNPAPGGMGTDTKAKVGDVLTFIIQFTPVPNNASRGAGGYITEYVPANTEVVGARIIDRNGKTVAPKRGPQMDDGWGPRNNKNFGSIGLESGSLSAVYADTGIFFSTDARTVRNPGNTFITVTNGLVVNPVPTGAGQLDQFLGFAGPPFYSHNEWDRVQALEFGTSAGHNGGTGQTAFGFGSAVAGPETHYKFEKVLLPKCNDGMDNDADGTMDYPNDPQCKSEYDDDETANSDAPVGPWKRIRTMGGEIGTGGPQNCQSCAGGYVRVGVPTDLGWDLSLDNPLPAGTNAVRFAVGELIVGEEYFAEVSLRVKALPLDPTMMMDVNCSEVFGGDAAMPQNGQDNTWRYFVPAPACVSLNLFFELSVDKLLAVPGDILTYTINGKNLSVNPQTNVVVTDTFVAGDVSFNSTLQGPAPTVGNGLLTWPTMNLQPGDGYTFQWTMNVDGGGASTLNRARYVSDALPAPGFSVVALTDIEPIVVINHAASVATNPVTDPPATTVGGVVHYTTTTTNVGSGDATINASFVKVTLPTGFSFCSAAPNCGPAKINGINVANPAIAGNVLTFTNGLATVPRNGGQLKVEFDSTVGAGVMPGLYTINLQTQFRDNGVGRDTENSTFALAPLLVDIMRSDPPVLNDPVVAGAKTVSGTTSEGQGATVVVYVNGVSVPPVVAGVNGAFTAAVPTLFAGQHLNATAKSPNEVTSLLSDPDVIVQGAGTITFCNDGLDNDGDGKIDFPADPGCETAIDIDETDIPACSDGKDNDNNGSIDYPSDPGCSSALDNDESGGAACSNGIDDDGDGKIDAPADPGCVDGNDVSEADIPACANGVDDDNDGAIDYPVDPGCSDANDDDETNTVVVGSGGNGGGGGSASVGGNGGMGGVVSSGGMGGRGEGGVPDLGGINPPGTGAGQDTGCGCRVVGDNDNGRVAFGLMLGAIAFLSRRRRSA